MLLAIIYETNALVWTTKDPSLYKVDIVGLGEPENKSCCVYVSIHIHTFGKGIVYCRGRGQGTRRSINL